MPAPARPRSVMLPRPRLLPPGFIPPCLPIKSPKLSSGALWPHEIKHRRLQKRLLDASASSQSKLPGCSEKPISWPGEPRKAKAEAVRGVCEASRVPPPPGFLSNFRSFDLPRGVMRKVHCARGKSYKVLMCLTPDISSSRIRDGTEVLSPASAGLPLRARRGPGKGADPPGPLRASQTRRFIVSGSASRQSGLSDISSRAGPPDD